MGTMCSREIFTKKAGNRRSSTQTSKGRGTITTCHLLRSPKIILLYCRLIYMLSILCVRLTIKVKVGIPESFKVGWCRQKITGSSHLNDDSIHYNHVINKDFDTSIT